MEERGEGFVSVKIERESGLVVLEIGLAGSSEKPTAVRLQAETAARLACAIRDAANEILQADGVQYVIPAAGGRPKPPLVIRPRRKQQDDNQDGN